MILKLNRSFPLVLIMAFFLLQGCTSSSNLTAEAPTQQTSAAPAFVPKLSTINIPVSFKLNTLEEKLNQEFTGVLYKDNNLEDDNLAVTVNKTGKLAIEAKGNRLFFTVPLHIYAKGRWRWEACKICPTLQKTEDTEFDIIARSESVLSFTEDYKIKTITTGNFEWGQNKPVLTLGPLKIGLARFLEPAMRRQMSALTAQLDQEIQNRINLKEYVKQAWLQLQQPIPVDKSLNAWLTITPRDIRVSPVVANNGEINLQVGFSSYLQTVTNGKPIVNVNPALPKLISGGPMNNEIQVGLVTEIPYAHATQLLQKQMVGKKFTFSDGKDQLTVHALSVSGSGDKLVLMLDVTGSTKAGFFTKNIAGKIFLKAVPFYDAATGSIRVRDLDYDLDTKDRILQTANWLVKHRFVEEIQSQINFPVKPQLENARNMLQQTLNESGRVHESVLLKGNITEIVPDAIYLTPTSIKAMVNAKGNLSAQIDKF